MSRRDNATLDAADILAACVDYVPVNVRVDQAIAAHRIAWSAPQDDPEARQLAMFVLRTIVVARTPDVDDLRAQLDYLTALPVTAWPSGENYTKQECRDETLAAIRRSIAWQSSRG